MKMLAALLICFFVAAPAAAENGKYIAAFNCEMCHREGGLAESLAQEAGERTDAEIAAIIRNPTSPMMLLPPRTEKDIAELVKEVRALAVED